MMFIVGVQRRTRGLLCLISALIVHALVVAPPTSLDTALAEPPSKTISIAHKGRTTLTARSAVMNVRVVITTAAAMRAAAWRPDPASAAPWYTPKSWVDNLVIKVNGTDIFVPLSSFLDLFDVREGGIRLEEKRGVLYIRGVDASESCWAEIVFDTEKVTHKRSRPTVPAGAVTEETTYRLLVVQ